MCLSATIVVLDYSRYRSFSRWYPNLMPSYVGLLEPRGSNLTPLKSTFNAEHFICRVVLVYLEWFRRNSLLKCVSQPKIAKNALKPPILGVQGRSRSSMLVPLESSSAVLVMIGNKSVSICNRFHARWANNGKITISRGTPLWCPRSRGICSPSATKLPHRKLENLGYHMVQTRSLYLTWPWIRTGSWQTDGQPDRIPIANTHSQQYLLVQLSRVKM